MAYETRTLSEILSAAASSFDSDLWNYAFERAVPIAIYVSTADDDSREIAEIIENRLTKELSELGFESSESLTQFYGSFLGLSLSRTKKTDSGPAVESKFRILRKRLVKYFKEEFFQDLKQGGKDAQKIIKIAIGVGTIVILMTTAPVGGLAVGTFVISAKTWAILMVAKEGTDVVEQASKLFFESPEGKASLGKEVSNDAPVIIHSPSEKQVKDLERQLSEQQARLQEQQATLQEQQSKIKDQELRQKQLDEQLQALRASLNKP
jgi:hypothetical protein